MSSPGDMQQTCSAPRGPVVQEQFLLWPLFLMLFFQQVLVSHKIKPLPHHSRAVMFHAVKGNMPFGNPLTA